MGILSGRLYFGDKTIGEVRVPLKDLIQESSGIVRFVNYQVSTPDWKPNGLLNFSFKVYAKGEDIGIYFPTSEISGYSAVHHQHQSPEIQYPTSEVESSSLGVYYPSIELEDSPQETYHAAQILNETDFLKWIQGLNPDYDDICFSGAEIA
ncbi:hypothetical protein GH714_028880 [Hevea brasiliensis]|uniref:Uncharacterized protein n=1 Tax=Hevea brasiliensis TaxID=3981 RepID=A0A6A6LNU1_HEVBR|nr:hypothetical protein GH714_028880 [Hevea brasiliensis]